jgi:hypothetical protein
LVARVRLVDLTTQKTIFEDSIQQFLIPIIPGKNYALHSSRSGYLFDSRNFQPTQTELNNPFEVTALLSPLKVDQVITLNNIFFDIDKFDLKVESEVELKTMFWLMNSNPRMKLEISGHTDNTGSEVHNKELSQNRALAVKNYLIKYSFKNVTTDDFLNEIKKISKFDCEAFRREWLESPKFDYDYAIQLLSKNKSLKTLLDIKRMKATSFIEKRELFEKIMISNAYFPIKEEIIYQCEKVPFDDKKQLIKLALATNEINVRQAIANTTPKVSLEFKSDFESLLNDNSYITKEISLSTFWAQFPEDQKRILDNSKEWIGFNDKNLRILWLTLALGTKEYQMEDKAKFYDELLNYCNTEFETSIRQNAMENLLFINDKDKNVLPNLVNSITSFRWQFSKFGKDKIRLLLKNPNIRFFLEELLPNLSKEENFILSKILAEKTSN